MKQFFSELISYLKDILVGGIKWVFDLFAVLGIVLFFLPELADNPEINELLIRFIGGGIFLLSFLIANFFAYRTLLRQRQKKPAAIKIQKDSIQWGSSTWQQGLPKEFGCTIYLDVRNDGDEQGKLLSISVNRMELGTTLLGDKPRVNWFREGDEPGQGRKPIQFPYLVESHAWNIRLSCRLETGFFETNLEKFASRLNELKGFLIELCYEYETFDGKRNRKSLLIQDTFKDFRKDILKNWLNQKRYDLVCSALNVEALIDDQR